MSSSEQQRQHFLTQTIVKRWNSLPQDVTHAKSLHGYRRDQKGGRRGKNQSLNESILGAEAKVLEPQHP